MQRQRHSDWRHPARKAPSTKNAEFDRAPRKIYHALIRAFKGLCNTLSELGLQGLVPKRYVEFPQNYRSQAITHEPLKMQVHTSSFLLMQQNLGTDINYAEITNSLCSFSAELLKKNLVFALIRKILLHLNTVMLRYNLPCKIKYIPSLDYRLYVPEMSLRIPKRQEGSQMDRDSG